MTRTLQKVQKRISKKKGSITSLHENSRDFQKLRRAASRSEKLEKEKKQRGVNKESIMERIRWFAKEARALQDPAELNLVRTHVDRYMAEKSTLITAMDAKRRPGRPKSLKQSRLEQMLEADTKEYQSGFWLPDMISQDGWKALRTWCSAGNIEGPGEWATLDRLLYVRVDSNGDLKRSSFPPHGS